MRQGQSQCARAIQGLRIGKGPDVVSTFFLTRSLVRTGRIAERFAEEGGGPQRSGGTTRSFAGTAWQTQTDGLGMGVCIGSQLLVMDPAFLLPAPVAVDGDGVGELPSSFAVGHGKPTGELTGKFFLQSEHTI